MNRVWQGHCFSQETVHDAGARPRSIEIQTITGTLQQRAWLPWSPLGQSRAGWRLTQSFRPTVLYNASLVGGSTAAPHPVPGELFVLKIEHAYPDGIKASGLRSHVHYGCEHCGFCPTQARTAEALRTGEVAGMLLHRSLRQAARARRCHLHERGRADLRG